jgi:hypothetical protein
MLASYLAESIISRQNVDLHKHLTHLKTYPVCDCMQWQMSPTFSVAELHPQLLQSVVSPLMNEVQ